MAARDFGDWHSKQQRRWAYDIWTCVSRTGQEERELCRSCPPALRQAVQTSEAIACQSRAQA